MELDKRGKLSWLYRIRRVVFGSITGRLISSSLLMSVLIVVIATSILGVTYRRESEEFLHTELDATIRALTSALRSGPNGKVMVDTAVMPNDPRYDQVWSGWYYGFVPMSADGDNLSEIGVSRSLWDADVPVTQAQKELAGARLGGTFYYSAVGPEGEPLRVAIRAVQLPEQDDAILVFAGITSEAARQAENNLRNKLIQVVGLMLIIMLATIGLIIYTGLRPLRLIRENLDAIREGRATRLSGDYSTEIKPLVDDMNRVLQHNEEVVDRTRTHVGNLAHALKNPLAVLMNEPGDGGPYSELVKDNTLRMRDNVDHWLRRAQTAARAQVPGARTEIEPVVEDIAIMLERIHRDKNLAVELNVDEEAVFRGEKQDLEDLVGNLMENAAKWMQRRMSVTVARAQGFVTVHVDDDGPGLKPEDREIALLRGKRLDETAPGSGLGLSIVKDTAEIYGGSLSLHESPLGGLRATLELPAAV